MPIYEYQCVNCDAVIDIKHGFKETAAEACPQCGGIELKRLFNAASIVFKGSGFYVTDSRKARESGAAKAGSPPKSDASPKTDAAPEAHAAPKSDSAAGDSASKNDATSKSDSSGKGDAAA